MSYPSESDWAWLAGIVDGEGYIGMVKRKNLQLARRLAITSTSLPLLVRIGERFGGKIHPHNPPTRPNARQQFQWYANGDSARPILHGLLPYLVIKREEAELYLAFDIVPRAIRYKRVTPAERERREALLARVQVIRKQAYTVDQIPAALTSRVAR